MAETLTYEATPQQEFSKEELEAGQGITDDPFK